MSVLNVFVAYPWLALLPAILLGLAGHRLRRTSARIAAVAWLLYAVYELSMRLKLICAGECDIRVDLLLIYPLLLALTLVAVIDCALAARRRRRAE